AGEPRRRIALDQFRRARNADVAQHVEVDVGALPVVDRLGDAVEDAESAADRIGLPLRRRFAPAFLDRDPRQRELIARLCCSRRTRSSIAGHALSRLPCWTTRS